MNRKQSKIVYYDHSETEVKNIKANLSRIIDNYEAISKINDPIDQCENNYWMLYDPLRNKVWCESGVSDWTPINHAIMNVFEGHGKHL